jgi:hypothetical protein
MRIIASNWTSNFLFLRYVNDLLSKPVRRQHFWKMTLPRSSRLNATINNVGKSTLRIQSAVTMIVSLVKQGPLHKNWVPSNQSSLHEWVSVIVIYQPTTKAHTPKSGTSCLFKHKRHFNKIMKRKAMNRITRWSLLTNVQKNSNVRISIVCDS